jgi:hypothetical protein
MLGYYANQSFTEFLLTVDSHPCEDEQCNTSDDDVAAAELVVLAEESKNLPHTLSTVM